MVRHITLAFACLTPCFETQELDEVLKSNESLGEYRRTALFNKWNECVFKPLQSGILDSIDEDTYRSIISERSSLFEKYLALMKKDQVFIDTIYCTEIKHLHTCAKVCLPC